MQFYIGFFLPTPMNIKMNKRLFIGLPVILMTFLTSCEKKYQSPGHYEEDLFADERQEGKAYIMSEEECFDGSELVIAGSGVKLTDSSKGRGRGFFIYRVNSGKVLKTVRDSTVQFPMQFLSPQRLKLKGHGNDSIYVYLKQLKGYRFIAKDKNLKYQWLKAAPVYSVKEK
ncbi:hypothetical protein H3Z85_13755 [Chryseobacterium indologenes]|nr:hypothetical protein EGY07_14985 [Chryseobacterium indologenes]GAE62981.1 hypothetical protein CIN01S_02_01030 [Chryseobacterium indologenes NBRC 14944]MBF6645567.1 hypothetical protein [Chryseobacterium indologenes]MBU3050331.1 hypothetical protein [Chryseobacterium indologenes]QPQ50520.1 hypothetical protein H3Z85_13755 [Chryseobacterium indologenes]